MKTLIIFLFLSLSFSAFSNPSQMELRWLHFTSPAYKSTSQLNDYSFLRMNHNFRRQIRSFSFNSEFLGEYFLDHSKVVHYSAPELYLSYFYKFNSKHLDLESISITFGRKAQSWSIADKYWDFGLWNPLNRWNPLHPTSKGLIGTFFNIGSKNWSIDMLVGGLYLPSSHAKSEFKQGQFSSSLRWFSGAPNKIDVLGRSLLDIEYLLKVPFLLDLFFQQSYVLSFKTWLNREHTIWTKWAYGYKPVNDLFILTNSIDVLELKNMQVSKKVTILPVKHTVFSSEWGFKYEDFSAVLSVGHTSTQEDRKIPEGWEFFHDRGYFTYFSALMKYNISDKSYLQLNYLDSWFDRQVSSEEIYQDTSKVPFILSQYKILEGIGFDLHIEYAAKNNLKRQLDINYKYSFPNKGGLLFVQATYYLSPKLYTSITADILGAKVNKEKYFLNKFRANDYIGWRLGYVF